jgi:hypothetical protein
MNNCQSVIKSLSSYTAHMRLFHEKEKNLLFRCTFDKCKREFSAFSTLMRHLRISHEFQDDPSDEQSIHAASATLPGCSSLMQTHGTCQQARNDAEHPEIPEHVQLPYNFAQQQQDDALLSREIRETMLKFLMKLHSKGNLTKSIISEIFICFKEDLLDRVCELLQIDEKHRETIDESYRSLKTQYMFEKSLVENGYISGGKHNYIIIMMFK